MKKSHYCIFIILFLIITSPSVFSQQSSKSKYFPDETAPVMVMDMPNQYRNVPDAKLDIYNPFQFDIIALVYREHVTDTIILKQKSTTKISNSNCELVVYVNGKPCKSQLRSSLSYRLFYSKMDSCYSAKSLLGRNLNANY